jgi:hypothetical protein
MNQAQLPTTPLAEARTGQCSPLPWIVSDNHGLICIRDANGRLVVRSCEIEERNVNLSETNARFIVAAVNVYGDIKRKLNKDA